VEVRNTILAVLGALVLVLKHSYAGAGQVLVRSYAGNASVSFALYFAALSAATPRVAKAAVPEDPGTHVSVPALVARHPRAFAAAAAFAAVAAFEATDGFGVMANTFDAFDFLADAAGIGVGVLIDVASARALAGLKTRPTPPRRV
jgi:hypothetical protein